MSIKSTQETLAALNSGNARAKRWFWLIVGLVISVALMWLLFREVDFDEFMAVVRRAPIVNLLAAYVIYLALNFCRALRFRALLPNAHVPIMPMFYISLYHNFLVRTLPFRTGEVSYVTLTNRHLDQPLSEGVSSLVGSRVFDLLLLTLGGALGFLFAGGAFVDSIEGHFIAALLIAGLIISIVGTYYSGTMSRLGVRTVVWLAGLTPLRELQLVAKFDHKLNKMASQLDRMRQPQIFFPVMVTSIFTYIFSMAFNIVLLNAIGVNGSLGVLVAVISVAMYVSFFPLSFSGFGITEGGWALGLVTLMGLSAGEAAAVGLFLHGCQIVAASTSGLLGYFLLEWSKRGQGHAETKTTSEQVPVKLS